MSELSNSGSRTSACTHRHQTFSRPCSTPSSTVLDFFIYTSPSVCEQLAYGFVIPEDLRAVQMAEAVRRLESIIESGGRKRRVKAVEK